MPPAYIHLRERNPAMCEDSRRTWRAPVGGRDTDQTDMQNSRLWVQIQAREASGTKASRCRWGGGGRVRRDKIFVGGLQARRLAGSRARLSGLACEIQVWWGHHPEHWERLAVPCVPLLSRERSFFHLRALEQLRVPFHAPSQSHASLPYQRRSQASKSDHIHLLIPRFHARALISAPTHAKLDCICPALVFTPRLSAQAIPPPATTERLAPMPLFGWFVGSLALSGAPKMGSRG